MTTSLWHFCRLTGHEPESAHDCPPESRVTLNCCRHHRRFFCDRQGNTLPQHWTTPMCATSNPGIRKGRISIDAIYYQVHHDDFLHIAPSKRVSSSTIFALFAGGNTLYAADPSGSCPLWSAQAHLIQSALPFARTSMHMP